MNPEEDPTGEIYKIMDESGLYGSNLLNSRESFPTILNKVRTSMAMKLKSYIVRRDHQMFNAGVESVKKIEVKEIIEDE